MNNAIRLLIVDDQASIRRGLRMRLELEPDFFVVGEAGNGIEALRLAQDVQPDVVVLDVVMPGGMDGIATAQALHDAGHAPRVVMLSLHDGAGLKAAARRAGASAFVCKHEPTELLLAALRNPPGDPA
jgi:DNA-binding NarL/FixJ family response regulator